VVRLLILSLLFSAVSLPAGSVTAFQDVDFVEESLLTSTATINPVVNPAPVGFSGSYEFLASTETNNRKISTWTSGDADAIREPSNALILCVLVGVCIMLLPRRP
jgi:hypothetical protein